jgi:FlgD Ig-like domain/HYDIN/CFA65/VesB-like, Ig-like domain
MDAGGDVYIEGATIGTGGYTNLYPYLGLGEDSYSFAGYSLIETIYGMHFTFLDNTSLTYMYGSSADYGIDELDVQAGTVLYESQDHKARSAYFEGEGFRSIVSSSFFGSMVDDTFTKAQVMEQYLTFLAGDPVPNISTDLAYLDFELQFINYPESESITIQNTGLDTLSISDITISGDAFSYTGATSFELLASGHIDLEIMMDAAITGLYSGELTLFSNDPDSPELIIPISGTCVQPPIITTDALDFNVDLGGEEIYEETLTIFNNGGYDLEYSIIVEEVTREVNWLELDHHFNVIDPTLSDEIIITFDSEFMEDGTYMANLVIVHNDPSQDDLIIPITMSVISVGSGMDLTLAVPELGNNYPNPFNPQTTISFSTTENTDNTEITIFNSKGQKIKTLLNEVLPAGNHNIVWNGKDEKGRTVSSGIYLYKMRSGIYSYTKKMILMK